MTAFELKVPPPVFVLAITRLQVIPEERTLLGLFGEPLDAYLQRVPRWL